MASDPGQGAPRRPEALKAQHGPGPALDPAVVLLDPVVEPAAAVVPREAPHGPSSRIRRLITASSFAAEALVSGGSLEGPKHIRWREAARGKANLS